MFVLGRTHMKLIRNKTGYLCVNNTEEGRPSLKLQCMDVPDVEEFNYIGSTIQGNGDFDREVKKRIKTGWNRWRKIMRILCAKRAPVMAKGEAWDKVETANRAHYEQHWKWIGLDWRLDSQGWYDAVQLNIGNVTMREGRNWRCSCDENREDQRGDIWMLQRKTCGGRREESWSVWLKCVDKPMWWPGRERRKKRTLVETRSWHV